MRAKILSCFIAAMVGCIVGIQLAERPQPATANAQDVRTAPALRLRNPGDETKVNPAPQPSQSGEFSPDEVIAIRVYENANQSVANIATRNLRPESFFLFEAPAEGSGSGVVIDKMGHILTNYHVIEGAREILVTLSDEATHDATVVGSDPANDIAVLQIAADAEALHPIPLGDSSHLKVGQRVFAIGNPFGLERTLTSGIISSLNRTIPGRTNRRLKSIIQIDAAINPGNSGGPLVDSHGRLIGINTAIASRVGQSSGVGFAIPVNNVKRVVPQLLTRGRVIRPDPGIEAVYQTPNGLRIAKLSPGGPAELAGLRGARILRRQRGPIVYESIDRSAGDLIVAVDGRPVATVDDFLTEIESNDPGDTVEITVIRNDQEQRFKLTLVAGE